MYAEMDDRHRGVVCGDALRPIPDQEWVCVALPAHDDDHVAVDGTRW